MNRPAHQTWLWAEGRRADSLMFLAALLAAFVLLSVLVHSPGMRRLDEQITMRVQSVRRGWLDSIARAFTFAGNPGPLCVLAVIAGVILWRLGRPWAGVLGVLTMLGQPMNLGMKRISPRTRPEQGVIHVILPAVGFSFPSGHAMVAAMFFGFLAMVAWIHLPDPGGRIALTSTLALLPIAIGVSRIYLGAHWFSDVIAGWTAGLFCVLLLAGLYKTVGITSTLPH